jgi:hypothetical protein
MMPDQELGQIIETPTARVPVDALLAAESPRGTGENQEHVEALAAAETRLPPIIVHRPTMRVIDGLHRLNAAKMRGAGTIEVRFFDGDEADAFVVAVKSNIAHGLPLSLADRKRAAVRIIASHPQWSDRMIASVTGIAAGTVADLRKRVAGGPAAEDSRIGQDGRVRPIDGAAGRRLAGELIMQNPSLSLRQVARAAGISPETVRDVRNRLRRGEDPVPRPRGSRSGAVEHRNGAPRSARPARIDRATVRDPATAVDRLRSDPALRFSEAGRDLLRLLGIHTLSPDDWNKIIDNVPPHCGTIVAQLARDCAEMWGELASRVERQVANIS